VQILVLEDCPNRTKKFKELFNGHTLEITNNADEAIKLINDNKYDFIFLDHDLGGRVFVNSQEYDTGFRVAVYIPKSQNKDSKIVIHSWNPGGALNMKNALKECDNVRYIPFGSFTEKIMEWTQ